MSSKVLRRSSLLQPQAAAAWLYDNTGLTYEQIADCCGLDREIVEGIANGVILTPPLSVDLIADGYVDQKDIEACVADHSMRLNISKSHEQFMIMVDKAKKGKYIPISKRKDKPNAIAWLLKNHPYLTDDRIIRLVRTTRDTINAVKDRTHWNAKNIKLKDPVTLGLCSQEDLEQAVLQCRMISERNDLLNKVRDSDKHTKNDNDHIFIGIQDRHLVEDDDI